MGKARIDNATLPKNTLEFNLPGGSSEQSDDFYNLPIPSSTEAGDYQAWVRARKTKNFIFWSHIKATIYNWSKNIWGI